LQCTLHGVSDRTTARTVFLKGLEVYAYHGVTSEEQQLGRRFRVDVEVEIPPEADWTTDSLSQTADYGKMAAAALRVAGGERHRLLETLAERILTEIRSATPLATRIRVTVEKLHPPLPGTIESAGVTVERRFGEG